MSTLHPTCWLIKAKLYSRIYYAKNIFNERFIRGSGESLLFCSYFRVQTVLFFSGIFKLKKKQHKNHKVSNCRVHSNFSNSFFCLNFRRAGRVFMPLNEFIDSIKFEKFLYHKKHHIPANFSQMVVTLCHRIIVDFFLKSYETRSIKKGLGQTLSLMIWKSGQIPSLKK